MFFKGTQSSLSTDTARWSRFEEIDRKFAMEQSAEAKAKNLKGKLDPIVTPTVLKYTESAVAQLTEIFCVGYPMFTPVTTPEYSEEMDAMRAGFAAQQRQFGWERNMILFFKDAVKYNFGAVETFWNSYKLPVVNSDDQGAAKVNVQDIDGNEIKRLDPYNVFYDTTVAACQVHTEGAFVGYSEKISRINLHMRLSKLPANGKQNVNEALKSINSGFVKYYRPVVIPEKYTEDENWFAFFNNKEDGAETDEAKGEMFYYSVLYARIIPKEYGISVPNPNDVTPFKFIVVNGCYVVYAEALTDSHQYLPILISEPTEDGLRAQTKSYAERVVPIQNLSSDLHTARIASLRRAVGDRALYDPSKISAKDVNSPNPAAKIPVRNIAYGANINSAYYQIPYVDQMAQYLLSEASQVERYGMEATGQNPSSQGNFIPGNKTQTEFTTIMSNANNRTIVLGRFMESQTLVPLKTILLFNTLQYQQSSLFVDIQHEKQVNYNPIDVRKINWEFEMADGLLPVDKIANSGTYTAALQFLMGSPDVGSTYNVGDMFAYIMNLQGVRKLSQFKYTSEQLQQMQQQRLQLAIAQAGGEERARQIAQGNENGQQPIQTQQ